MSSPGGEWYNLGLLKHLQKYWEVPGVGKAAFILGVEGLNPSI